MFNVSSNNPRKDSLIWPQGMAGQVRGVGIVVALASVSMVYAAATATYSGKVTNGISSPVTITISGYKVPARTFVVSPGANAQYGFSAAASTYDIKAILGKSSSGHRVNQPSAAFKVVWDNQSAKTIKLIKL